MRVVVEERFVGPVILVVVLMVVMIVRTVGRAVWVHGPEVTTTDLSYFNAEPPA